MQVSAVQIKHKYHGPEGNGTSIHQELIMDGRSYITLYTCILVELEHQPVYELFPLDHLLLTHLLHELIRSQKFGEH